MYILLLGKRLLWSRQNPDGGTTFYHYYDEITWVVGALAIAWIVWFLLRGYLRVRAMRRPSQPSNNSSLKQIVKLKSELSSNYLRPGFSTNIHAVGVGTLGTSDEYCIQVFVRDATVETAAGSREATVPETYRGVPVRVIEMPAAGFLSQSAPDSIAAWEQYPDGIRDRQEVIVGGISGANTSMFGQSGTIGYFCTRKSKLPRRKEVHLLSNSHVFADLRKPNVDEGDLIAQPSPGESGSNRPIGALVNFSPITFDGDLKDPNHVDAAIAKLWRTQSHKALIPLIGAVKGFVQKKDIKVGEAVRKFGRTTGYTEGRVFSIYLDIWIKYDRTGQSAFFKNQLLIEPTSPKFDGFVAKGDSGALLVDAEQYAIGLVFAGVSEVPGSLRSLPDGDSILRSDPGPEEQVRIEGYGIANPISEVLDRLKIELLV